MAWFWNTICSKCSKFYALVSVRKVASGENSIGFRQFRTFNLCYSGLPHQQTQKPKQSGSAHPPNDHPKTKMQVSRRAQLCPAYHDDRFRCASRMHLCGRTGPSHLPKQSFHSKPAQSSGADAQIAIAGVRAAACVASIPVHANFAPNPQVALHLPHSLFHSHKLSAKASRSNPDAEPLVEGTHRLPFPSTCNVQKL